MSLVLYAHPFSSYSQKALIALYETGTEFDLAMMSSEHPDNGARFASLWPLQHMPLLTEGDQVVAETSIIIEHRDLCHPGSGRMIPADPRQALHVRFLDRVFDNHVMTPMMRIVFDAARPSETRDPTTVADARDRLDRVYAWLDANLSPAAWAAGPDAEFGLADCAAAPSLLYADRVHPIDPKLRNLRAYRARLLARPSVARVVEEARPYRHVFPPGKPDRD